jgi:UDP:flavonoid glycosyltransferase YjiC (YdhE family)
MKILFLVQGEGRGHLTQAISMGQILTREGHEISGVLVGNSVGRTIPSFFKEQIHAPMFIAMVG